MAGSTSVRPSRRLLAIADVPGVLLAREALAVLFPTVCYWSFVAVDPSNESVVFSSCAEQIFVADTVTGVYSFTHGLCH